MKYLDKYSKEVLVEIYVDTSVVPPKVLSDEDVAALNVESLPEHIIKETSTWRRVPWSVSNFIDSECTKIIEIPGKDIVQVKRDPYKRRILELQLLLLAWSLEDIPVSHVPMPQIPGTLQLSPQTMKAVNDFPFPSLINTMLNEALNKIYLGEHSKKSEKPPPS